MFLKNDKGNDYLDVAFIARIKVNKNTREPNMYNIAIYTKDDLKSPIMTLRNREKEEVEIIINDIGITKDPDDETGGHILNP